MYTNIVDPVSGKKYQTKSSKGSLILRNYVKQVGGNCDPGKYEKLNTIFRPEQVLLKARQSSLEGAWDLGLLLKNNNLDLVTAESLTAGMIGKTIIDIPYFGAAVLYGGFTVYNTDAKRLYLNVNTPSVYSQTTAGQMAKGALMNSRAMVGLAVTGNAMPYPEHSDATGTVDVGLAVRTGKDKCIIKTTRINICEEEPLMRQLCGQWKAEGVESDISKKCNWRNNCTTKPFRKNCKDNSCEYSEFNLSGNLSSTSDQRLRNKMGPYEKGAFWEGPYARFQTTSRMSEGIRLFTVGYATKWAAEKLQEILNDSDNKKKIDTASIPQKPWDKLYNNCGEPSMLKRLGYDDEEIKIGWPDSDCCGINANEYDPKCPEKGTESQLGWHQDRT
jgi:nicotinamide mononucleotide (NMN) deamidase PncC